MVASGVAMAGIAAMLGPAPGGPRLGDLLAVLATAVTALMTVAICRSREVEMLPVAGLSTILSALARLMHHNVGILGDGCGGNPRITA
jgi:drug/metabolite transporter (DMT)-like permease